MPPGAPALTRPFVASVAIMVSDRERSRAWYTERLGLSVIEDEDHWLTVGRPEVGGRIHLCLGSELGEGFPLEPGNTGITIAVPTDPGATLARLRAAGVGVRTRFVAGGSGWDAELRDPDGNLLLLVPSGAEPSPGDLGLNRRGLLAAPPRPPPKA